MNSSDIKEIVKEKYGRAAARVKSGGSGCCSASNALGEEDPITRDLYAADETATLPQEAVLASLGCGNPTALAELSPGETVLDLGSGGGIDVLLSARRVGPTGKAYGLDMTDEMLSLARENQQKAGVQNVEFLKGEIENIPLPENSVDVIISNCVINLSADKDRVLKEAFRVLKPGGRFAVSDVVVRGDVPSEIRKSVELWIGCVAGALEEREYRAKLAAAGFESINIEPTRIYQAEDAREFLKNADLDADSIAPAVDGKFASAFIRARKPGAAEQLSNSTKSIYTEGVAELVAIGASIASNCEPCFRHHYDRARKLGVSKEDMASAVKTAQMVKDSPARAVLELADRYLKGRGPGVDLPVVDPGGSARKSGCCS
jgi:arsenite methyltransferase